MTFGDYLKLPGLSHSTIKGMQRKKPLLVTEKMQLGTLVHQYLLEPHLYDHLNVDVKSIAMKLKERIGPLIEYMQPELSVTCDMHFEGYTMQFKGRVDLGIVNRLVIDCKVINGYSVWDTLDYMGYNNQLSGYSMGIDAKDRLICAYSTKTKKTELITVPFTDMWWKEQIKMLGI